MLRGLAALAKSMKHLSSHLLGPSLGPSLSYPGLLLTLLGLAPSMAYALAYSLVGAMFRPQAGTHQGPWPFGLSLLVRPAEARCRTGPK